MLDIACGEGRFARQLAEHGYHVTGIDISEESINTAKSIEAENVAFFIHDMRCPFRTAYFDYAFNFFTSFGYFKDDSDNERAAASFATSLKKGGILVIDYLNFEYVLSKLVPEETITRGDYTFHITRKLENNHIVKCIRFADDEGKEHSFQESVAGFSLADFNRMLRDAGMTTVGTFGDYQLNLYDPVTSPRLIMIFKKMYA
jgi:SAM-dependent methyltransferase